MVMMRMVVGTKVGIDMEPNAGIYMTVHVILVIIKSTLAGK